MAEDNSALFGFKEFEDATGINFENDFKEIDINEDEKIDQDELKAYTDYLGKNYELDKTIVEMITQMDGNDND